MFEQTFKNIDDILHKDAGCTSELDYTEQSSWLLFLKYLDALEADKASEAELEGKTYRAVSSLKCDTRHAIEDTPEVAENMKLRSVLMTALRKHITQTPMSQAQAARLFGVTQPRVSDLRRGKINLFALDALVNMVAAAGLHIELQVIEAA